MSCHIDEKKTHRKFIIYAVDLKNLFEGRHFKFIFLIHKDVKRIFLIILWLTELIYERYDKNLNFKWFPL